MMFKFGGRGHRSGHGPDTERRFVRGSGRNGEVWPGGASAGRSGGSHFGGGGRLGRLFAHGDLHVLILHLIGEKPRHGYDLIKAIEEMAGGGYTPSPGTIYPALTLLEEQGSVVIAPSEGSKKLYTITSVGTAYLASNAGVLEILLARLKQARAAQGADAAPDIARAVENIKLSLHLRLARGGLNTEQTRALSDILDRAASEIERV